MKHRSFGLIAIVLYKAFVAGLLFATSAAFLLALEKRQSLAEFASNYVLQSNAILINWLIHQLLNLSPKTLEFTSLATAAYASISTIEAFGLWFQKQWASVLVIVLIGISIPLECLELMRGFTILKFSVFVVNVAIFVYLLRHALMKPDSSK